jgi:hypothetical protein
MSRHPFDALSAFFGFVFTAAAVVVLIAGRAALDWDTRWVWPTAALALGVILLLSGLRSGSRRNRRG